MTAAEELRAAAQKVRAYPEPFTRLVEPLAAWLESAAEDSEVIGTDHRALAVARAINEDAR